MGTYNTYIDGEKQCQLKIGDTSEMICFNAGDKVPIQDGLYLEYGGIVIVKNGIFVGIFDQLIDKWGGIVDHRKIVDENSPVTSAIKEVLEKMRQ